MAGVVVSAVLHSAALAGIVWLTQAAAALPRPAARTPDYVLTFLRVPSAPIEMPAAKLPTPPVRLPAETPKPVELKTPEPVPEPSPVARVEPKPLPPAPTPAPAPEPVKAVAPPPKPVPPPVQVGAFADATNTAPNPTPGRQVVQSSGFDATPARSPELKLAPTAAVGGFDSVKNTEVPRPGTDRPAGSVMSAGFGGAAPVQRATVPSGAVVESGFGATAPSQRNAAAPTNVRAGAFDVQPAVREAAVRTAAAPIDVPVEILFKPTPAYTDEARALKLEGDVVLEVEFSASKEVRVVRVVRGMGHGLDESAAKAAAQIRFKPAQANGKPVDFRATLHIVFRLT